MSPIDVWRRWTAPTVDGELAQRREAVLLTVLASMVVVSLTTQILQLATYVFDRRGAILLWWLVNVAVGAAFYGLLRLARAGRHRFAAVWLAGVLSALVLALLLADGAEHPMWALLLAFTVVLTAILLGGRAGLAVVAAASALVPIVGLQYAGTLKPLLPDDAQTATNVPSAVVLLGLLAFMATVCFIYTRDVLVGIDDALTHGAASSPLRQLRTRTLSMREIEVVQLVAEGLSNDAIASRLFVSPRTVQSHVATAMKKTDCANRTALGVLALREGLVALVDSTTSDATK